MKNLIPLFLLLFLAFSCRKDIEVTSDYRDALEGDYRFKVHHYNGNLISGTTYDTTYWTKGFVKKFGAINDSLVEIHYGTDTVINYHSAEMDIVLLENSPLKLSYNNKLFFPGEADYGSYFNLHGFLKSNISITDDKNIKLIYDIGPLGAWDTHVIYGYKM